jgi:hypothetical protein
MVPRNDVKPVLAAHRKVAHERQIRCMRTDDKRCQPSHKINAAPDLERHTRALHPVGRLPKFQKIADHDQIDRVISPSRNFRQKTFECGSPAEVLHRVPASVGIAAEAQVQVADQNYLSLLARRHPVLRGYGSAGRGGSGLRLNRLAVPPISPATEKNAEKDAAKNRSDLHRGDCS